MNFLYKPEDKQALIKFINNLNVSLGEIDTSLITDMSELFDNTNRTDFSGLEHWDTSKVTNMRGMFRNAVSFNHPIGNWDTPVFRS